jgi:hypothetical protein
MRNGDSMFCVATVSDVRRDNARLLAKQAGGLAAFAKKIGRADPYVSQLIGKNPQRGIGHAMARYIEECFSLEPGWLDAQHDDEEPLSDSTVAFARWYQKLAPDEREKLRGIAALALGKAVPDEVVEQRMPVTKPINTPRD